MAFDMQYDGQKITWFGKGLFNATSGLLGYRSSTNQGVSENGLIPEGRYKVFLSDHGVAVDDGAGAYALRPSWGIQSIPKNEAAGKCEPYWANWGKNRARMEPADASTKVRCSPILWAVFICMIQPRDLVTVVSKWTQKYFAY